MPTDLLKTLGELDLNITLLETRKKIVMQQLLEHLRDGNAETAKGGEATQAPGESPSTKGKPQDGPV